MKAILLAFSLLASGAAFAAPAKSPTHFKCGGMGPGTVFSVQFDGPRYADMINLSYVGSDIKPLLLLGEENLVTFREYLHASLQTGGCKKVENSDVLVSCEHQANDWTQMNYGFTKNQQLAKDFVEVAQISRRIEVEALDLKVTKVGTDAMLRLAMTVTTSDKPHQKILIEKKLATLNQDWYNCKFE